MSTCEFSFFVDLFVCVGVWVCVHASTNVLMKKFVCNCFYEF